MDRAAAMHRFAFTGWRLGDPARQGRLDGASRRGVQAGVRVRAGAAGGGQRPAPGDDLGADPTHGGRDIQWPVHPTKPRLGLARTLNPIGQARVTLSPRYEQLRAVGNLIGQARVALSPRYEQLRAVRGPRQEEQGPEIRAKRFSQATTRALSISSTRWARRRSEARLPISPSPHTFIRGDQICDFVRQLAFGFLLKRRDDLTSLREQKKKTRFRVFNTS